LRPANLRKLTPNVKRPDRAVPRVAAPLALAYVLVWFGVGFLPLPGTDLDQFFRPSAMAMLRDPLSPYQAAGQSAYPNANGPLALVPLAAVIGFERAAGVASGHLARGLTLAFFSVFILLTAREAVSAVERTRGPLSGIARLLAYGVLTLGPTTWQGDGGYGHVEQPIETWLILLSARGVEGRRPVRAGVALGLAVLARSPALLFAVPLTVAAYQRRARDAVVTMAAAAATGACGILPFLLADRADVVHSLVTYRGGLLVGVGSIWTLTRGTPLEGFAQHADVGFILGGVIASTACLASRRGGLAGPRVYAALALAAAAFALLAKTVWPYYFVEVYVLGSTWALAQPGRSGVAWRWIAMGLVVVTGLMAEAGATRGIPDAVDRLEGGAGFLLLAAAVWLILRLAAVPPPPAGASP
jgi:hypothetical protein